MHIHPTFNDKVLEMQIPLTGQCDWCLMCFFKYTLYGFRTLFKWPNRYNYLANDQQVRLTNCVFGLQAYPWVRSVIRKHLILITIPNTKNVTKFTFRKHQPLMDIAMLTDTVTRLITHLHSSSLTWNQWKLLLLNHLASISQWHFVG